MSTAMSEHEYRENKFFSIFGSVPEPGFDDGERADRGMGPPLGLLERCR